MRRNDQPRRPSAMTCSRFSLLKTWLMTTEGNFPPRQLCLKPPLYGRFSLDHLRPLLGDHRGAENFRPRHNGVKSLIGVKFTARNRLHFGFSFSATALEGHSSQIPSEACDGIYLDNILECFPNSRNPASREKATLMVAGGRLLLEMSKSVLWERRASLGREGDL